MKFAIPLANGKLTAHFGHCQEFALIEVVDNEIANKQIHRTKLVIGTAFAFL